MSPSHRHSTRPRWYWPAVLALCVVTWGLGVTITLLGARGDDRGTTIAGMVLIGLGLVGSVVSTLVGRG